MIGVDTNVLVRLLTRDDEAQYQEARKLFESSCVFLGNTVLLETEWVLRYSYNFSTEEIDKALSLVLGLSNVVVADVKLLKLALECHRQGMDFADALHRVSSPTNSFHTFDRRFHKKAKSLLTGVVLHS